MLDTQTKYVEYRTSKSHTYLIHRFILDVHLKEFYIINRMVNFAPVLSFQSYFGVVYVINKFLTVEQFQQFILFLW